MSRLQIWTDGSCFGNPGPGAWAALIRYPDQTYKSISGFLPKTTSNRAELTAILQALLFLTNSRHVDLYSDSRYCVKVLTGQWRIRTNLDLIRQIRDLLKYRVVRFHWICRNQNPADDLAQATTEAGLAGFVQTK